MTDLKIGDKVWCYSAPCFPHKGIVTELRALGSVDIIRCHLDGYVVAPDRVWTKNQVFKRPDEKQKLINQLEQDGYDLIRYAKVILEASDEN